MPMLLASLWLVFNRRHPMLLVVEHPGRPEPVLVRSFLTSSPCVGGGGARGGGGWIEWICLNETFCSRLFLHLLDWCHPRMRSLVRPYIRTKQKIGCQSLLGTFLKLESLFFELGYSTRSWAIGKFATFLQVESLSIKLRTFLGLLPSTSFPKKRSVCTEPEGTWTSCLKCDQSCLATHQLSPWEYRQASLCDVTDVYYCCTPGWGGSVLVNVVFKKLY